MKAAFRVRMKVGSRLGAGSAYTLREICTGLVERYSLTDDELWMIVQLAPGGNFQNSDLSITRRTK